MKSLIMSISSLLITLSGFGQKLDAAKVPAPVKAAFTNQFPGVAAKWEKEDGKFEASFKKGTVESSALFEADGRLVEVETGITVSSLPAAIIKYIQAHYKTPVKAAARISTGNNITYEAAIKGKDIIFDANGHYLKEIRD